MPPRRLVPILYRALLHDAHTLERLCAGTPGQRAVRNVTRDLLRRYGPLCEENASMTASNRTMRLSDVVQRAFRHPHNLEKIGDVLDHTIDAMREFNTAVEFGHWIQEAPETSSLAVTQSVWVRVRSFFDVGQSDRDRYAFVYILEVANEGMETIQLMRRRWHIKAFKMPGKEIEGEGVIGQQPILKPGAKYTYDSFYVLPVPYGIMKGEFTMRECNTEKLFRVTVAPFLLTAYDDIDDDDDDEEEEEEEEDEEEDEEKKKKKKKREKGEG